MDPTEGGRAGTVKRLLVLTVDHEVFGDGSGDVRRHVCEPAWRMAAACERFGMRLTLFFEVEEYLALLREGEAVRKAWGYHAAAELREQAIELARHGHDLQLHLHPEWFGAVFEDGCWRVRPEQATVGGLFDRQEDLDAYIRSRIHVIEGFRQAAGVDPAVRAFRAGGFRAQPGLMLLEALRSSGVMIESSVVKGMVTSGVAGALDFSAAPVERRHWRVKSDVVTEDPEGPVVEVPVYSRMGRRVQQLTVRRLAAKFSSHVPESRQRAMIRELAIGGSPGGLLRFLCRRFPIKLDYHNMSAERILHWIHAAEPAPVGDLDVMVLIGHTKEHRSDGSFVKLLAGIARDRVLQVVTMDQLAAKLRQSAPASRSEGR